MIVLATITTVTSPATKAVLNTNFSNINVELEAATSNIATHETRLDQNDLDVAALEAEDTALQAEITANLATYTNHKNGTADKHSLSEIENDSSQVGANAAEAMDGLAAIVQAIETGDSNAAIGVYEINALGTNTYTATYADLTYFTGLKILATIQNTNTGASTLNINSLGAKNIKKMDALGTKTNIEAGDLPISNKIFMSYDGTDFVVIIMKQETYSTSSDNTAAMFSLSSGVRNAIFNQALISGRTYTNLLDDSVAGCEATAGWDAGTGSLATDNTVKFEGTNCIKATLGGATLSNIYDVLSKLDVTKYYLITLHVRNGNATYIKMQVNCVGDGGTIAYPTTNTTTSWVRQGIAIQPSNFNTATQVYVYAYSAGSAGQYTYFDGFQVNEMTAAEFASATYVSANIATQALMDKYPFVLGTKSSAPQEIKSVGKNLFNKNDIEIGKYLDASGVLQTSASADSSKYIPVNPSTNYIISGYNDATIRNLCYFGKNKDFISAASLPAGAQFTTPVNAKYVRFTFQMVDIETIQLELGTVATTYAAYQSSTVYTPALSSVPYIADKYDAKTGLYTKNTDLYTVTADDVTNLTTSGVNADKVRVVMPAACLVNISPQGTYRVVPNKPFNYHGYDGDPASWDAATSIGKYTYDIYFASRAIEFFVAKGAYGDLAAAKVAFTGLTIQYALAISTYEKIQIPSMQSFENGSILSIAKIRDSCLYDSATPTSGFAISNTDYPIDSLDRVYKQSGDTITEINVSSCTVAAGGLTFTSTEATNGDYIIAIYNTLFSSSTIPTVSHSEAIDSAAMIESNASGLNLLSNLQDRFMVYQNAVNIAVDARLVALE